MTRHSSVRVVVQCLISLSLKDFKTSQMLQQATARSWELAQMEVHVLETQVVQEHQSLALIKVVLRRRLKTKLLQASLIGQTSHCQVPISDLAALILKSMISQDLLNRWSRMESHKAWLIQSLTFRASCANFYRLSTQLWSCKRRQIKSRILIKRKMQKLTHLALSIMQTKPSQSYCSMRSIWCYLAWFGNLSFFCAKSTSLIT